MYRKIVADHNKHWRQWNITVPIPEEAPDSQIELSRWKGTWAHVKYDPKVASQRSVVFDDNNELQGIYTTGIADCVCVALLVGRETKYKGDYYSASLTHLPGGDVSKCNWKKLLAGTEYNAEEIQRWCGAGSWACHAVIGGNKDQWLEFSIESKIHEKLKECGFSDENITFYLGRVQPGFGVHRKGWFGVPTTFGSYSADPLDKSDSR